MNIIKLIIICVDSWIKNEDIRRVDTSSASVVIDNLSPAQSYSVRVVALNGVGSSLPSGETRINTVHEPPSEAPSNVQVLVLSSTSLKVTWPVRYANVLRSLHVY